jgi:glycerate dehydrogenase
MKKAVFLNSARLDFDKKLDYSPVSKLAEVTVHDASSDAEILARVKDQDIVITKELPVGRDLIMQFPPSVKIICEAGTGYNNIDIAAAKEKGIAVCNVPGYSTEAVAQLVIASMLNLASSLKLQALMLERKNYDNFTKHLMVPHFEVQGKTLGILGAGSIGQAVIKTALALGMNILTHNRTPKEWGDARIKAVSLEELLKQSDFVSIHSPLTPDTKHLINMDKLKLMKPTAYIINTSRGPIIKETDIIEALKTGVLAGAALDVQEIEPPELTSPLYSLDNVILTPHIGWKTLESRQRLINMMADNIEAFINGSPVNVVNK